MLLRSRLSLLKGSCLVLKLTQKAVAARVAAGAKGVNIEGK